jgi:subtilisin
MTPGPWRDIREAQAALENGRGEGVRIALLDSGVEASHPALDGLILTDDLVVTDEGASIELAPGKGVDVYGHGTAVASVLRRLAPAVQIGSFRVLDVGNQGRPSLLRAAVREAIARGYHILNCSFGCRDPEQRFLARFKEWVDEAYLSGVHIVAACNNFDAGQREWPGFFPTVITVNMADVPAGVLVFRPGTLVEFAAQGVNVELPWRDGGRKVVTGSSFAAPVAAALLARMLSVLRGLDPLQAKALLQRLASPSRELGTPGPPHTT